MKLWSSVIALAVVLSSALARADVPPESEQVFSSQKLIDVERQLVEATNAERERRGLAPLEVDFGLMSTARRHTAWMANSRIFQHGRFNVAENIALGQQSVVEAIRSWMNSPGHRANMLNSGHRRLGVAAYLGPNGQIYWTQQFKN